LSTKIFWITSFFLGASTTTFVGAGLPDRFLPVLRTLWPSYSGDRYSLDSCDVCCLISLVIPLVWGSVNERVDCISISILSLALALGRLVVDVFDEIAGTFPCRLLCFVVVFGSPDLVRGVSEPDFFPVVDETVECGDCSPVILEVVVGLLSSCARYRNLIFFGRPICRALGHCCCVTCYLRCGAWSTCAWSRRFGY